MFRSQTFLKCAARCLNLQFHQSHLRFCTTNKIVTNLKEIEENLFENSTVSNSPVDTKQHLDKLIKPLRHRPKYRKSKKAEVNEIPADQENIEPMKRNPVKSSEIFCENLNISYVKLDLNDPWLPSLLLSAKSKKYRSEKHQLIVEGRRLISDALSAGLSLKYLLFSHLENLQTIKDNIKKETKIIKVPQSDLCFWSNLSTCPGLIGIFEMPEDLTEIWKDHNGLPITVICDNIREPNNLGSIIRNCAAVPCSQVILTKGCADPWETKALRGGSGGHFLVPIKGPLKWSSVESLLPEMHSVYIAENDLQNVQKNIKISNMASEMVLHSYTDVSYNLNNHNVLIIGGETHGISTEAYSLLSRSKYGKCINIPLADGVDSLNTASALAVILFEIKKKITSS